MLALWVKRQALETDTWADTSTELLEDATIRDAVGDFTVAALFDNVDVEAELGTRLSPQLEPLAGPAAGGLRKLADRAADEALSRPKAQAAWEDATAVRASSPIELRPRLRPGSPTRRPPGCATHGGVLSRHPRRRTRVASTRWSAFSGCGNRGSSAMTSSPPRSDASSSPRRRADRSRGSLCRRD